MPNSEQSFADRAQKAQTLLSAIYQFTPTFAPPDVAINPGNFASFLQAVDASNDAVMTALTAFSTARTTRVADFVTAKEVAARVLAFVKANPAWKLHLAKIRELTNRVRLNRAPRKSPPAPAPQPGGPPTPPPRTHERGDGSFAEMALNFKALAAAVNVIPGYSAPDAAIDGPGLTALATLLGADNDAMSAADTALVTAQKARAGIFYDEGTGLEDKFAAIKAAVKGQYGVNSPQYAQVKVMRW